MRCFGQDFFSLAPCRAQGKEVLPGLRSKQSFPLSMNIKRVSPALLQQPWLYTQVSREVGRCCGPGYAAHGRCFAGGQSSRGGALMIYPPVKEGSRMRRGKGYKWSHGEIRGRDFPYPFCRISPEGNISRHGFNLQESSLEASEGNVSGLLAVGQLL